MQVAAKLKYARISPQKCRLVADLVRGKPVGLALNTLRFTPKKGAELVRKVLESAIANAENNLSADVDELKVQTITVDAAPVLKRFHARAKGRGNRICQAQQSHHRDGGRRQERVTHMGQKVNPIGIRLGITRDWTSKWYASTKNFPAHVYTDHLVREFLKKRLVEASVSRIQIERAARKVNITIHTARPGIVIGKKGEDIEKLRGQVAKMMKMPAVRRAHQHRRDPQARARCAAGCRRHCAAARTPRHVPSRDEARGDEHDAHRRARHQGARVGPPERRGNRAHRGVSRRPRAAAHVPRGHRLRPGRSEDHVRRDRREGVDLQGRSVRAAGAAAGGGGRRGRPAAAPAAPAEATV